MYTQGWLGERAYVCVSFCMCVPKKKCFSLYQPFIFIHFSSSNVFCEKHCKMIRVHERTRTLSTFERLWKWTYMYWPLASKCLILPPTSTSTFHFFWLEHYLPSHNLLQATLVPLHLPWYFCAGRAGHGTDATTSHMPRPPPAGGEEGSKLPVLVYFHGWGYCVGAYDQFHSCCKSRTLSL